MKTIQLERDSRVALYQQIVEQVKLAINSGRLTAGTRLPTIRQLAQELQVTRATIQNAYDELQAGGWIESTVGRGTFVSEHAPHQRTTHPFGQPLTPDAAINDILQINDLVGVRSLAGASPDPRLFPADEFWAILAGLRSTAATLTIYGSSQGDPQLRAGVAQLLQDRQLDIAPDSILITAGVTQGFALLTQALCHAGDKVLVEQPTYLGFLHTIKGFEVQPIGVPLDAEGPQLEAVERLVIQERPRFLYTAPAFQNPTGSCMSAQRGQDLLALAERYGFFIVEDDIYARIAYDQAAPTPLKAYDRAGVVIYMSGFSKMFMPGLRLGYLVAPPSLQPRLLSLRRGFDLGSPSLLQLALARFLSDGGLKRHLRKVLPIYRGRRDAALSALAHAMPPGVTWTKPKGGFCCWLTLPKRHSLHDLDQAILQNGWAFAPGEVFLVEPDGAKHFRVCFGQQEIDIIQNGIATLGRLIRDRLQREERQQNISNDWTPLV